VFTFHYLQIKLSTKVAVIVAKLLAEFGNVSHT